MSHSTHNPWKAVVHFLTHSVTGLAIFGIIAVPAVLLNLAVAVLSKHGVSKYVLNVLTLTEYAVLTVDALVYLALLCKAAYKGIKELEL